MFSSLIKYFSKHVYWNSATHLILGLGIGVLLARPLFTVHPVRYGLVLIAVGLIGHLYPLLTKLK